MFGGTEGGSEEAGLVQRSLRALFRSIKLAQAEGAAGSAADNDYGGEFGLLDASSFEDNHGDTSSSDDAVIRESSARATFFEIFNEKVYDLLSEGSLETALNVREDATRGVYVDGLEEVEVRDVEEAEAIIAKGLAQRSIASTSMNRTSSRSHACFVLTVRSAFADASDGLSKIRTSRFTLVDLAGALCCVCCYGCSPFRSANLFLCYEPGFCHVLECEPLPIPPNPSLKFSFMPSSQRYG